jgi:hypothetical protein
LTFSQISLKYEFDRIFHVLEKLMEKDDLWIVEHFSELVTKYPGRAIAVVNEQLVAVGDNEVEVESIAKQKYPNKIPSVLTVPREEDMACLL